MRILCAALAVPIATVLSACGPGGGVEAGPVKSSGPPPPLTAATLQQALLTTDDVPGYWLQSPNYTSDAVSVRTCGQALADLLGNSRRAEIHFVKLAASVDQFLVALGSRRASEFIARVRRCLARYAAQPGGAITPAVGRSRLGDESLAFRIDTSTGTELVPFIVQVSVARSAGVLVIVEAGDLGEAFDSRPLFSLSRRAMERLAAVTKSG